jgi:hypothetical protein
MKYLKFDETLDENGDYYILRIDNDPHAQIALAVYANSIKSSNEKLANDIETMLIEQYGWTAGEYTKFYSMIKKS